MGQRCENLDDLSSNGQLGDWCFYNDDKDMFLRYPDGSERGDIVHLYINHPEKTPSWQWDGNREAPTLSPSINVIGRWHGWLRAGKLETA